MDFGTRQYRLFAQVHEHGSTRHDETLYTTLSRKHTAVIYPRRPEQYFFGQKMHCAPIAVDARYESALSAKRRLRCSREEERPGDALGREYQIEEHGNSQAQCNQYSRQVDPDLGIMRHEVAV